MDDLAEELKEMYAHFGLTAYCAQCFEIEALNILLLHARLSDLTAPVIELEELESKLNKKTLGSLLRDVKKRVSFQQSAERIIDHALARRNYLFHSFFSSHAAEMLSSAGRQNIIAELEDLRDLFQNADLVCKSISRLMAKLLGITDDVVEAELQNLRQAASRKLGEP